MGMPRQITTETGCDDMINEAFLKQNVSSEDREAIRNILAPFVDSIADRTQLNKLANAPETFALEKKYVPLLNRDNLPVVDCDVLVCPVGFRPPPVILTILMLKPKRVYLLPSSDTRRQAEAIRDDYAIQRLGLDPDRDIQLREISLTNAPENYEIIKTIVNHEPKKQIVVDVTGGVKVMGVSLAAAAFWLRLPVIYLYGEEVKGIIKPFTEKLNLLQNPYDHFGDTEFQLLKAFFDIHNYDAALKICISLRDTVGDIATLGMLDILAEFIEIYRAWDGFAHSQWEDREDRKLATQLRVLIGKMQRLNLPLALLDKLEQNLNFLERIETSWQRNKRNLADKYRLVDIYCAAQRRAKSGKYDDAVARLYRCLEMSATILLINVWCIQTPQKPDFSELQKAVGGEKTLQEQFFGLAQYELPKERLGLDVQMKLLEIGGKHQTVCGIYKALSEGSPSLMEWRNRSTLAHGTVPVPASVFEQLNEKTKVIIRQVVGADNLSDLLEQATHPHLTILQDLH
jgi:CRISPR-associated protein (TIGR02710 family)